MKNLKKLLATGALVALTGLTALAPSYAGANTQTDLANIVSGEYSGTELPSFSQDELGVIDGMYNSLENSCFYVSDVKQAERDYNTLMDYVQDNKEYSLFSADLMLGELYLNEGDMDCALEYLENAFENGSRAYSNYVAENLSIHPTTEANYDRAFHVYMTALSRVGDRDGMKQAIETYGKAKGSLFNK